MKIFVPVQLVPDLVEELVIDANGAGLDPGCLRWILNEFDDHAIEQAVLLKEKGGAEITVAAPDLEGVDDVLFTAAAKGADHLVKLLADYEQGFNNHALARLFLPVIQAAHPDLVLTGVQTHNSLDGPLGPLMAELLGMPYVGYVSGVTVMGDRVIARKEYPGGLSAEMEVILPAVLGIQAAEKPPRYVPVSKVRQFMKTSKIDEQSGELDLQGGLPVVQMSLPETAARAEMIEGDADAVASRLVEIMKEQGII